MGILSGFRLTSSNTGRHHLRRSPIRPTARIVNEEISMDSLDMESLFVVAWLLSGPSFRSSSLNLKIYTQQWDAHRWNNGFLRKGRRMRTFHCHLLRPARPIKWWWCAAVVGYVSSIGSQISRADRISPLSPLYSILLPFDDQNHLQHSIKS